MKHVLMAALAATALMLTSPASATTLKVEFDVNLGGLILIDTWEQDSNPTPNSYVLGESTDVPIWDFTSNDSNDDGSFGTTNSDVIYVNGSDGGGFSTGESIEISVGPQVYSGLESSPVFSVGTYDGHAAEFQGFTIVVLPFLTSLTFSVAPPVTPPVPVPEPSTWAMMAIGFAGLGYASYRRTREPRAA
jgi:PEP-CTERM motif